MIWILEVAVNSRSNSKTRSKECNFQIQSSLVVCSSTRVISPLLGFPGFESSKVQLLARKQCSLPGLTEFYVFSRLTDGCKVRISPIGSSNIRARASKDLSHFQDFQWWNVQTRKSTNTVRIPIPRSIEHTKYRFATRCNVVQLRFAISIPRIANDRTIRSTEYVQEFMNPTV